MEGKFSVRYARLPVSLNQKGNLAFGLLMLLMTITALMAVFVATEILITKRKTLESCQSGLLDLQSKNRESIENLLNLNPAAKQLRSHLSAAQKALKAATMSRHPAAIAAARAWIASIELERRILGAKQKTIIAQANLRSNLLLGDLKKELRSYLDSRWIVESRISDIHIQDRFAGLAVRPDLPGDSAPLYETMRLFSELQSASVAWRYKFDLWQFREPEVHKTIMRDQCTVSLKIKRKNTFEIFVRQGKW